MYYILWQKHPESLKVENIVEWLSIIFFNELKRMVSAETLLSYPERTTPFIVHTDAYDKQLGAITSQNNKTFTFL